MWLNKIKKLNLIVSIFIGVYLFLNTATVLSGETLAKRGIWVTAFTEKKVLYSREAVFELLRFCKAAKIDEVYLQFYRGGQAYYDSSVTDRTKYEEILKTAGSDMIDFLLEEARGNKIKIFAWLNILSLAQNKDADIISRFGGSILTRDQYLRPSLRSERPNETDRYYLRDEQLFLEPGDPRVIDYTLSLIDDIIARYPAISGIHLDYIRYPYPVPFLPDSRFNKYGLTYGYGEKNIERFKGAAGLDPLSMAPERDNFLRWDNWKRDQVTSFVKEISAHLRKKMHRLVISAAVIPSPERAYDVAFQDWPLWLEKGIIDYVVLMNYTKDNRSAVERVKSSLAHRGKGKVFAGIGAFLMKDNAELFFEQYKVIRDLRPDGMVFFSYDDKEIIMEVLSR